jgi:hypothetical protein
VSHSRFLYQSEIEILAVKVVRTLIYGPEARSYQILSRESLV